MRRLRFINRVPYGGRYVITDPVTSVVIQGSTFEPLFKAFCREREANGFPIGLDAENELMDLVCRAYPAECEDFDPDLPRRRNLGFNEVLNGTKVMLAHHLAGSPLVSGEEAGQRAAVCIECSYNRDFDKPCGGLCEELKHLVRGVTGSGTTEYDSNLKSCQVCGCFLTAAVHLPLAFQCAGLDDRQKQLFGKITNRKGEPCWKRCL